MKQISALERNNFLHLEQLEKNDLNHADKVSWVVRPRGRQVLSAMKHHSFLAYNKNIFKCNG